MLYLYDFQSLQANFHEVLMHYTMQGYRVIALAQRQLRRMSYVKVQRAQRDDLERQLSFLGQSPVMVTYACACYEFLCGPISHVSVIHKRVFHSCYELHIGIAVS